MSVTLTLIALSIQLPADSARLKPGPGVDTASAYCYTCHSVDYIQTQPPNEPHAFWAAEVAKMRKTYGAPIPDDKVDTIVNYLTKTYGDGKAVTGKPARSGT